MSGVVYDFEAADVCPDTGLPFEDTADSLACPACTDEGCYLCGAGLWRYPSHGEGDPCEHDVIDRHEGAPRYRNVPGVP